MNDPQPPATESPFAATPLTGVLHIFVAFDWGEEINLEAAQRLVPSEPQTLPRRRRTPSSIAYQPPPLRVALPPVTLEAAELGPTSATAEATLFDFAGVSLALHIPFALSAAALTRLAGSLAESGALVNVARDALVPLFAVLRPAIRQPQWSELTEEYVVFEIRPEAPLPAPEELVATHAAWLAGLARLEAGPFSQEEVAAALRLRLTYNPHDLLVAEWGAAVLLDRDCDETLQTIELANLQLLEFRFLDNRLDAQLLSAYSLLQPRTRGWLPAMRRHTRPLRALGELKIEAHGLFDRASNVLKLVGDQYLARAYRLFTERFHLPAWEQSIRDSLSVVESIYQVVSDQAAAARIEFLEFVVVLLILLEIVMSAVGR